MLRATAPEPSIFVEVVDQADFAFFAGLEEDRAGAVAEDDAGGAVGVVDDAGHDVRADDENVLLHAGLDELGADLEGVREAGAGGGEIEAPGVGSAEFVLHEAGGGGKHHVWRHRRDDDDFDVRRGEAALGEAELCGFNGEIAGGDAGGDDVALADAGALGDPLVAGGDHGLQVFVGEEFGWDVGPTEEILARTGVRGFRVKLKWITSTTNAHQAYKTLSG